MTAFAAGITVSVLRQAEDKFGNWTTVDTVSVGPCAIDFTASSELTDQRETVTRQATLYAPAGADIRPTNFVLLPDRSRWSVVGHSADFVQPWTGWHPGVTVRLEAVTG